MIYYDFVVFRSQFQENTIVFVKSFLSKPLKATISSKLGEWYSVNLKGIQQ